jgi:hypothetical protein
MTASSFIASKLAPTVICAIFSNNAEPVGAGLPAMAVDQTTQIPGTKKPAIIH